MFILNNHNITKIIRAWYQTSSSFSCSSWQALKKCPDIVQPFFFCGRFLVDLWNMDQKWTDKVNRSEVNSAHLHDKIP